MNTMLYLKRFQRNLIRIPPDKLLVSGILIGSIVMILTIELVVPTRHRRRLRNPLTQINQPTAQASPAASNTWDPHKKTGKPAMKMVKMTSQAKSKDAAAFQTLVEERLNKAKQNKLINKGPGSILKSSRPSVSAVPSKPNTVSETLTGSPHAPRWIKRGPIRPNQPGEPEWWNDTELEGKFYYWHNKTGKTFWNNPLSPGWVTAVSRRTGRTFYYNEKTKESTYTKPAEDVRRHGCGVTRARPRGNSVTAGSLKDCTKYHVKLQGNDAWVVPYSKELLIFSYEPEDFELENLTIETRGAEQRILHVRDVCPPEGDNGWITLTGDVSTIAPCYEYHTSGVRLEPFDPEQLSVDTLFNAVKSIEMGGDDFIRKFKDLADAHDIGSRG